MKISNQVIVAIIATLFIPSTNALTLFSEGFESASLNGWQLSSIAQNWTVNQTNPNLGMFHAQARPLSSLLGASILEKQVSTAGYQNITVSYYRKLIELDASDEFRAKWYDGTNWITLEQTASNEANDSDYVFKTFTIPLASNSPNFAFRFECSAQALNEFCRVDDILVNATNENIFSYAPGFEYNVTVNSSEITFTRTNDSFEQYSIPLDAQNHFTMRKNYVWFDGQIVNATLLLNQYAGLHISHSAFVNETAPGVFQASVVIPTLPYFGISTPTSIGVIINQNTSTLLHPAFTSISVVDRDWNASAHVLFPMLFQTQLVNNTIEVQEWVKVEPSWIISLI